MLFQRDLRMLHGQGQVFLREVEHVEDHVFLASVLSVVDRVHHFHDGLALMYDLLFAVHKLEHELSGLFVVTHGAGLAALWGSWARYVMDKHISRFVQFAVNVMAVTNDFTDPRATALRGIEAIEHFFQQIGMPTSIPNLIGRKVTDEEIETLVAKCSRGGKITLGAMEILKPADMTAIYRLANA